MKIKTYILILTIKFLIITAFLGSAAYYAVLNITLYNKAPVTKGQVIALGTDWTGGSWTCTVKYNWKNVEYVADVWYHLSIDVNDDFMVHIDESEPDKPYTTMWWLVVIIVSSLFFLLNLVVYIIKVRNARYGKVVH